MKFHPERKNDAASLLEFHRISEAAVVLTHRPSPRGRREFCLAEWKAVYDLYGEKILKEGRRDAEGAQVGGCFRFDPTTDPMRLFKEFFATENPYVALHRAPPPPPFHRGSR